MEDNQPMKLPYTNPVAALSIYGETLEAIARLLADYPGADQGLSIDINAAIMAHVEKTRKEIESPDAPEEKKPDTNAVYTERNMCISLIVRMAMVLGIPTGVKTDPEWPIVFVDLPNGQVSWHIPYEEFYKFFPGMEVYQGEWDGHTTEEKYNRVVKQLTYHLFPGSGV